MNRDENETNNSERERKQKEWEARQKAREKKQREWEEKLRERSEKQKKWEERANKSKIIADHITKIAYSAEPQSDSGLGDVILTLVTGGLNLAAEVIKSPKESFNDKIAYLKFCSKKLNEAREYFHSHKNDMISEDKEIAFSTISRVNEKIKNAWADLNNQKQKAWQAYQREKEEKAKEYKAKQAAWEERQRIKAEKQKLFEENKKAWEERERIKAQKKKEWEERQRERERKQKEWEERQRERERERERKQREWEERQRERERKQKEWEERQRERQRRREENESRRSSHNRGRNRGGCYITTATCLTLSKPDGCYELSMIRKFRDTWLINQKNGPQIIKEYYELAPMIVNQINSNPDFVQIYGSIWKNYLRPFFELIELGDNKQAYWIYSKMVHDLRQKFIKST